MPDFERNITGQAAVTTLMESMGLTAPASIADSLDPTAKQLWKLATEVGQELLDEHDWQFLGKEFVITTTPGDPDYALPADFNKFIVDSQWNRTTRLPAVGSLREYEWQMLKARNLAGTTFTMLFRVENNQVVFYETPSTVQTVVLPYTQRGWVRSPDATPIYRDNLQANDDTILYDSQLFKAALRRRWRIEKGFDTTRDEDTYSQMLEKAKTKDTPGRTLSLAQGGGYPYLGVINIPDTGYGS